MGDVRLDPNELMALAAFRYCCGRSTYIVGSCVEWLLANWMAFQPKTRELIQRDLEREFERDDAAISGDGYRVLGMDMDRREWERVRALWTPTSAHPGAGDDL